MPRITVLMPFYNAAVYLRQAIDSVLRQSFDDFELLAIDDASTDGGNAIFRSYNDPRIRLVKHEKNEGVSGTLNHGLDLATGDYIARMDADDICMPFRFEKQLALMEKNPGLGVCGSWVRFIGTYEGMIDRRPDGADCVRASLCLDNPICHPSVMIRRSVMENQRFRYDSCYSRAEDYDLWSRMSEFARIDNIPEVMLSYRVHSKSITSTTAPVMEDQTLEILRRELSKVGVRPSDEQLLFHRKVGHGMRMFSRADIDRSEAWLLAIMQSNSLSHCHAENGMKQAIGIAWFKLCLNCGNLGSWMLGRYRRSILAGDGYKPCGSEWLQFVSRILWNMIRVSS